MGLQKFECKKKCRKAAEVLLVGKGQPAKCKLIAIQVYATSKLWWNTYATEPPKNLIRTTLLVLRHWAEAQMMSLGKLKGHESGRQ